MMKRIAAALALACALWTPALAQSALLGVQIKDTPAPELTEATPAEAQRNLAAEATPAEAEKAEKADEAQASAAPKAATQQEREAAGLGTRILMRGLEGEDVALMQQRLFQLGYYLGEVDGVFGLQTSRAVYAFQRAHKLAKIDGKVGKETIARMFSDDVVIKPTPTPSPTPTPTPTPAPTPTPVPTPVPTAVPDPAKAPFAMETIALYLEEDRTQLIIGRDGKGEALYPLCGVMSHMGYAYSYASGSWQLQRARDGAEIALMTDGVDGEQMMAMGSFNGVLFLSDETCRVWVYGQEAYVTAALLEQLGVNVLLVGDIPVIH